MERLTRTIARAAAAALPALLAFALVGCPNLSLRDYVEQKVLEYDLSLNPRPILVLKDGTTTIGVNGSVTMPDTIFGVVATRTLTIENHGNQTLTLGGTPVGMTGFDPGSNYMLSPPVVTSIAPGGAPITFDVNYGPTDPDTDYGATFVINSNDPANPAYGFSATGHSTQWHGMGEVFSASSYVDSPQIAIAGSTIYVTYCDSGIKLTKSTNGGRTWSSPTTLVGTSYPHSIAASGSNFHLFIHNSSLPELRYYKSDSYGASLQNEIGFSVNSNYQAMMNSAIVLANSSVYLCFYDTTNSRLRISASADASPYGGMGFTTYDVTGGTTGQTGGHFPSLKVVQGPPVTYYVSYRDGTIVKLAKATSLSGPWTYKTIATDTSNIGVTSLATETSGHILWYVSDGSDTLHISNSTDGLAMANWTADASLSPENAKLSVPLPFVSAGGSLFALYYCYSYPAVPVSISGIRLAKSTNGGTTWSGQWLDQQVGSSGASVSLAIDGQNVYTVYNTPSSHPNGYSITMMKSLDGGVTW